MSEFEQIFSSSGLTEGEAVAVFGGVVIIALIIGLIGLIFKVISRWVFFSKCGEEGWKAIIPVYTDLTLLNVSGLNWWWILIMYAGSLFTSRYNISTNESTAAIFGLLSLVGAAATIISKINIANNISKKFNKSTGYTVLLVFFQSIMLLILGLSKDCKYDTSVEVSKNGIFKS